MLQYYYIVFKTNKEKSYCELQNLLSTLHYLEDYPFERIVITRYSNKSTDHYENMTLKIILKSLTTLKYL